MALLTASEPGRRNRRTFDAISLVWGAIVIGLSAAIASSAPDHDQDVAQALTTVLGWAGALWRAAFFGVLGLAIVIVVDVLLRRRRDLLRDLLVGAACVVGGASLLGWSVGSDWFPVEAHALSRWGYPELRLASATMVLVVVGPELVRSVRLLATWLVPSAALGAVVLGAALPSEALGALALGLGIGALVRLVFGTVGGVPPTESVRRMLTTLGVEVAGLEPSVQQRIGAAEYVGHDSRGRPLKVRVLGRDAQDTQRLARRWRSLAYRDPPRSVADGRLEQVEHEALATLMAAQAGVRVPEVVTAALGPEGDAVVATREPNTQPLELSSPEEVSDQALEDLWHQAALLHAAGISHGRLNVSNVLVLDDGPMSSACRRRRSALPNPHLTSTWQSSLSHAPSWSARSARSTRPSTPAGRTRSAGRSRTSSGQLSHRTCETSPARTRSVSRPFDAPRLPRLARRSPSWRRYAAFARETFFSWRL